MVVNNEPTDDLVKEMYARFGLAYYFSEVLHRGLCIVLATSSLPRKDLITKPMIEERLAMAFSLTLGNVITELEGKMPPEFSARFIQVLEKRNFLAHQFWFDRAHLMFRSDHINQLIKELDNYTEIFKRLDEDTSIWFSSKKRELGITDEMLNDSLAYIISGGEDEPLPGLDVMRDLNKKLKRKQCLVKVWEFDLPRGGKPLVFELKDRSLWQLCDVGLGWSPFQKIEPSWIEHPVVKQYLPADIFLRPKKSQPWEYEFNLKAGAVLCVKPGKQEKTFRWGIRTKNKNPNQKRE